MLLDTNHTVIEPPEQELLASAFWSHLDVASIDRMRATINDFLNTQQTVSHISVFEATAGSRAYDPLMASCHNDYAEFTFRFDLLLRAVLREHPNRWEALPGGSILRWWYTNLDKPECLRISFAEHLEEAAKTFEDQGKNFFKGFPPESYNHILSRLKDLKAVATGYIEAVLTAKPVEDIERSRKSFSNILALIKQAPDYESVWKRLIERQVYLAFGLHLVGQFGELEHRIWKLERMAESVAVSSAAQQFLNRVSRCYLYGFDVECVILCRSVLDAEFKAEIPDSDCLPKGRYVTLDDRIDAAKRLHRLPNTAKLAQSLKDDANRLVHKDPTSDVDAEEAVRSTFAVLSELHPK